MRVYSLSSALRCVVSRIMSSEQLGGASAAASATADTDVTAGTGASTEQLVRFNNKLYDSWNDALIVLRNLVNKVKDDPSKGWYRTDIIHEVNGSFSLRCSSCEKQFQIKNPANFL
jgi:hypothetical protein